MLVEKLHNFRAALTLFLLSFLQRFFRCFWRPQSHQRIAQHKRGIKVINGILIELIEVLGTDAYLGAHAGRLGVIAATRCAVLVQVSIPLRLRNHEVIAQRHSSTLRGPLKHNRLGLRYKEAVRRGVNTIINGRRLRFRYAQAVVARVSGPVLQAFAEATAVLGLSRDM